LFFSIRAEQNMSMPAVQNRRWTAAEVRRLIDEHPEPTPRYELVNGELLVTPSPSRMHQRIVVSIIRLLGDYVAAQHLGEVLTSPSDVRLAPDLIVQPDVYVIPAENGRRPRAVDPVTRLLLAVEVLSPGSARYDRVDKRYAYQGAGVPEYWLLDPDAQVIERWLPSDVRPEVLDRELRWQPAGALDPLVIDMAAFFAGVADT
jgi:Uma2 family endonuclease